MRGRLVIPMAGEGKRFRDAGYAVSKPFIDVAGKPMVQRVLEGLPTGLCYSFVARSEDRPEMKQWLGLAHDRTALYLNAKTLGPACTVLAARDHQPTNPISEPLLIVDCDTVVDWSPDHFESWLEREHPDAALVVTVADRPHYSYAEVGPGGLVSKTAEKVQISNLACCGIWWFRTAEIGYGYLSMMVAWDARHGQQEFYISPVFNDLIESGMTVLAYPVPRLYSMGTPEDLRATLDSGYFDSKE